MCAFLERICDCSVTGSLAFEPISINRNTRGPPAWSWHACTAGPGLALGRVELQLEGELARREEHRVDALVAVSRPAAQESRHTLKLPDQYNSIQVGGGVRCDSFKLLTPRSSLRGARRSLDP